MHQLDYKDRDWWMKAANLVAGEMEFEIIHFAGSHDLNYVADLIQDRAFQLAFCPLENVVRVTKVNFSLTFPSSRSRDHP